DMPAKRIDKYCDKATDPCETIDFEIAPIPSEQSCAAKDANDKKTDQKATVQISPKDHDHGQQKASRSFQAFCVENDAKQHRGCVWRSGEINVRRRDKRGVKQTGGEHGDTNCNCGCSGAQADGRKIPDDDGATCNYK